MYTKSLCCLFRADLAEVGACRFQVHKEDWTVMGSCDVTKVYSSAANYGCTVEPRYNRVSRLLTVTVHRHLTLFLLMFLLIFFLFFPQFSFLPLVLFDSIHFPFPFNQLPNSTQQTTNNQPVCSDLTRWNSK